MKPLRKPAVLSLVAALIACGSPERKADSLPPPGIAQAAAKGAAAAGAAAVAKPSQGKWRTARSPVAAAPVEVPADVKAVPYLQGYRPARDQPLVIEHDPGTAFQGLNLYVSGHAAEAVLMDMSGRTLHRWKYPCAGCGGICAGIPRRRRSSTGGVSTSIRTATCWPSTKDSGW